MGYTHGASALRSVKPDTFSYTPICFVDKTYSPPFVTQDGTLLPSAAWVDALRSEVVHDDVLILLSLPGAEWWRWSLTLGPRPYDFVDPDNDDGLPLIGEVVPFDLFKAKASFTFRYIEVVIDAIRDLTSAPITLCPPPPPLRDLSQMFAELTIDDDGKQKISQGRREFFERLRPTVEQYGIATPAFRMKVWRATAQLVQDLCRARGVSFLAPDQSAVDPDGFLKPELAADFVHANAEWGRMHLDRLITLHATTRKAM